MKPSKLSTTSLELLAKQLTVDEGKRLKAYDDSVGIRTVGIGHNFETVPFSAEQSQYIFNKNYVVGFKEADVYLTKVGLTEEQCTQLFRDDVFKHEQELNAAYQKWLIHGEVRGCVLLNMAFNLGIRGLLGFNNTLKQFEQGNFDTCSKMMLQSKWAKQVGKRSVRLAQQMKTNQFVIG